MVRVVAALAAVAAALVLASAASAAAPDYILVSGPGLSRPVLLADWDENLALLISVVDAPKARPAVVRTLANRPRLDIAEFWGWSDRPRPTRPSQANQHGWFYPAHRAQPPVIDLMVNGERVPRLTPTRALRILARHRIPTRLSPRYSRG